MQSPIATYLPYAIGVGLFLVAIIAVVAIRARRSGPKGPISVEVRRPPE